MNTNDTITCKVPDWLASSARDDDQGSLINEFMVVAVNIPFCAFAFLSNLAFIVTIAKTPSLQKPFNTLLCSLAATDCLTGITTQPIFVTLRLMVLYPGNSTCSYQGNVVTAFYVCILLTSGWSFVFLCVISFDRYYALSRPLEYRAKTTNKGNDFEQIKYLLVMNSSRSPHELGFSSLHKLYIFPNFKLFCMIHAACTVQSIRFQGSH